MPEEKLEEVVTDIKYRALMRKLSSLLSSSQDIYECKYMLKCLIPAGKRERFSTALEVFEFLENFELLGPKKLEWLCQLFQEMGKPDLSVMVLNFVHRFEEMI